MLTLQAGIVKETQHDVNGKTVSVKRGIDGKFYKAGNPSESAEIELVASPELADAYKEVKGSVVKSLPDKALAQAVAQDPFKIEPKDSENILTKALDYINENIKKAQKFTENHKKEIAIAAAVAGTAALAVSVAAIGPEFTVFNILNVIARGMTSKAAFFGTIKEMSAVKLVLQSAAAIGQALKTSNVARIATSCTLSAVVMIKKRVDSIARKKREAKRREWEKANLRRPIKDASAAQPFGEEEVQVKKTLEKVGVSYEDVLKRMKEEESRYLPDEEYKSRASVLEKEYKSYNDDITKAQIEGLQRCGSDPDFFSEGSDHLCEMLSSSEDEAFYRRKDELDQKYAELSFQKRPDPKYGYSLQARVVEASRIAEKYGEKTDEFQWRAGVIRSSVKYGSTLDEVLFSDDPVKAHENLLNQVKKRPVEKSKSFGKSKINSFAEEVLSKGVDPPETSEALKEKAIEKAIEDGKTFNSLAGVEVNASVGLYMGNPCSFVPNTVPGWVGVLVDHIEQAKNSDGTLNLGDTAFDQSKSVKDDDFITPIIGASRETVQSIQRIKSGFKEDEIKRTSREETIKETVFHEAGHILEGKLHTTPMSVAFREDRANENPDAKDDPLFAAAAKNIEQRKVGKGVMAKDSYIEPYAGLRMQVGDVDTGTEIVSTSIESLSGPKILKDAAKKDRESIYYGLSILDMEKPYE